MWSYMKFIDLLDFDLLEKNPSVKLFFSKEPSFLHNNFNFLMNWSANLTDLQFQIRISDFLYVIAPLAFDNGNIFLSQIFRLHTWILFAIFDFSCLEVKSEFLYQKFHWKSNSRFCNGSFNELPTSKKRRVSISSELR